MIKCQVIEPFTLGRYNELKNIVRKGADTPGSLYVGDVFECSQELAEYLTVNNRVKKAFVKIIEVIPEKKAVEKPKKKTQKTKK